MSVVANPRLFRDVGGRRMNIRDQEFTPEGTKVVFMDEYGTDGTDRLPVVVYSAEVVNGFVNPNTVKVVDDGGGAVRLVADFPNTAEWSRCAGGEDWVYYSYIDEYRVPGAGPAYIRRRVEGTPEWEDPVMGNGNPQGDVVLDGNAPTDTHRFVALSSTSSVLEERLVVYVRMPVGGPPFFEGGDAGSTWCWFADDGSGAEVIERKLYDWDPTISILSSLVRLVPDFPGMISMVRGADGHLRLQWLLLHRDSAAPQSYVAAELHVYDDLGSLGDFALSVGVRRVPSLDDGLDRVWCVYAVFQGPQDSRRSWVDSFLVSVSGPIDTRLPTTSPDPARVRVLASRRIEPWLDPSLDYVYISDDENFDNPRYGPSVSVTVCGDWGQNSRAATDTAIFSFGVMPELVIEPDELEESFGRPPPVATPPSFTPIILDVGWRVPAPLEPQRPSFEVAVAPGQGEQFADPETVTLGSRVYVFFTKVADEGDQFYRASVPL